MPIADSSASKEIVTAALCKILSYRTKDQNIGYIAEYLTAPRHDLKEVGGRRRGDSDRRRTQYAIAMTNEACPSRNSPHRSIDFAFGKGELLYQVSRDPRPLTAKTGVRVP